MLYAIGLVALMAGGCNNALNQPMPGQTPTSENAKTPGYGAAGGPLVPANNPNAQNQLQPTPSGGTGGPYYGTSGAPLVEPNSPNATPSAGSTQNKQQKSGYFPSPDAPLTPPSPGVPAQ
ncbi:MAG TPA: hypothetical protein VE397_20085 [Stellaceae bacterium]|nr:hypothetical protein [Stellaceae bacterium]